jgi:5-formyltetrahydrofolate cyclo-ligase
VLDSGHKKQPYGTKKALRQAVWTYMEDNDLVTFPRPCFKRIPNFTGSRTASENLKTLEEWKGARVIAIYV